MAYGERSFTVSTDLLICKTAEELFVRRWEREATRRTSFAQVINVRKDKEWADPQSIHRLEETPPQRLSSG
jgi:hypothetical protein